MPLGIIASGTAYGEWSVDELQSLNSLCSGRFRQSDRFLPCSDTGLRHRLGEFLRWPSLGYYLAAIIGVGLLGVVFYLIGKQLTKGKEDKEDTMEQGTNNE